MTHEEIEEFVKSKMSDKRYNHSLCVAKRAVELAEIYGVDTEKAYIAGMFHDILKEEKKSGQLKIISDFGIMLNYSQMISPRIYHGFAAGAYLKRNGIVEDDDILNAIFYHTTGRSDMSTLEKILYIADFTGEDRDFPEAVVGRMLSEADIDKTILYICGETIKSLVDRDSPICVDTIEMYNKLILDKKMREEKI